ncbi:MAG: hypothetical protein JNL66_01455 [Alphaproteobacteria bacterium]|nr:hypothetical protein [Alphaproteobacteria bacterium]
MNKASLATLGAAALVALSACTPRAPQPGPVAAAPAPAPDQSQTLPAPTLAPLPVADCRGPSNGNVTVPRGETKESGSVRFFYAGRDQSYRTTPYVYMLETNAPLHNSSGQVRRGTSFGLWRAHTQTIEACGRRYAVTLVRASDDQATIGVRQR